MSATTARSSLLLPALCGSLLLFTQSAAAQDAGEWGDDGGDDGGFVDMPVAPTPTKAALAPVVVSPLTLLGTLRSDSGMWTERLGSAPADAPALPGGNDNPFAKARAAVDLELRYKTKAIQSVIAVHGEYDFAYLHRDGDYDTATLRSYRTVRDPLLGDAPVQLREAFVAFSVRQFEFTLGRQIVAWGEGDGLSPLDVVNPRDMREPGLADLDDIRIPVLATRVGWFSGSHRVEAMVTHEAHWGFRGPPLGPFSPFPTIFETNPVAVQLDLVNNMRRHDLDYGDNLTGLDPAAWQYLGRWVYKGAGIDLGLYAGSVVDRQGVMQLAQADAGPLFAQMLGATPVAVTLNFQHLRYSLLGTSGARAFGSVLLKWELAVQHDHPYNTGGLDTGLGQQRADQVDAMLGVTYTGISNTMIGVETSKTTLLSDLGTLLFPIDAPWFMLRVQHKALRDTLTIMAVASMIGSKAQYGALGRLDATYELADGIKLGGGYVTFQPGDEISPFSGLDRHDRLMLRLRWDFRLL